MLYPLTPLILIGSKLYLYYYNLLFINCTILQSTSSEPCIHLHKHSLSEPQTGCYSILRTSTPAATGCSYRRTCMCNLYLLAIRDWYCSTLFKYENQHTGNVDVIWIRKFEFIAIDLIRLIQLKPISTSSLALRSPSDELYICVTFVSCTTYETPYEIKLFFFVFF